MTIMTSTRGAGQELLGPDVLTLIDRAFLGTIHSFCGRLLRERPFEAGLDPAFREVVPRSRRSSGSASGTASLETEHAAETPQLAGLQEMGVGPEDLYDCFWRGRSAP